MKLRGKEDHNLGMRLLDGGKMLLVLDVTSIIAPLNGFSL
jgi:hypothetical protein